MKYSLASFETSSSNNTLQLLTWKQHLASIWKQEIQTIFELLTAIKNVYSAICQSFPIISQEAIKNMSGNYQMHYIIIVM